MEESKLTMMQRKKIDYHLRKGEPLPLPERQKPIVQHDEHQQAYEIIMRARNVRKRSLDTIKASGAYSYDKFVPLKNIRETSDRAKKRLQELMSGVKEYPELNSMKLQNKYKHRKREEQDSWPDKITELLNEIYERADWLAEMEELGEGKKHREVIQGQIAERLRGIKRIEKERDQLAETIQRINQNKIN